MSAAELAPEDEREPRWQDFAVCKGATKLFFSTKPQDIAQAKAICRRCPVKTECLDEAFTLERSANSVFGVRGGLDYNERKQLRRQPRRGGRI